MPDAMQPFASGRRCSMPDAMKWPILDRMDPSCLTAGRPSTSLQEAALHA